MRVLQVNSFFSVGGPPRVVKGICDILSENGHSSVLAAGREKPIDGMDVIKIGNSLDKYINFIKTRLFDAEGLSSIDATKQLIKDIEDFRPDIIQLHNLHGYYVNFEILFEYLKKTNIPIVWTLHDCWAFTGHCAHFDYIGCEKWKTECSKCPQKNSYPKRILFDASKSNYEKKKKSFSGVDNLTIVTPSNWLGNLVKESFLKEYPVKVIHNGVDLDLFKPTKSSFRGNYGIKNKFIVLGVAQVWGEKKGFNYFVDLSKKLDDRFRIVMVGLSDKQKKDLPNNIIGINRTNSIQELAEIYSEADVFVNPTLEEVMGLTNVEALACGTPVITFNTGGSVECLDESCGMVVEKGNVNGLINAIKTMHYKRISSELCLERAKRFEKNDKYNEYINLYNSLL